MTFILVITLAYKYIFLLFSLFTVLPDLLIEILNELIKYANIFKSNERNIKLVTLSNTANLTPNEITDNNVDHTYEIWAHGDHGKKRSVKGLWKIMRICKIHNIQYKQLLKILIQI